MKFQNDTVTKTTFSTLFQVFYSFYETFILLDTNSISFYLWVEIKFFIYVNQVQFLFENKISTVFCCKETDSCRVLVWYL